MLSWHDVLGLLPTEDSATSATLTATTSATALVTAYLMSFNPNLISLVPKTT
jgi:hypothetical protein